MLTLVATYHFSSHYFRLISFYLLLPPQFLNVCLSSLPSCFFISLIFLNLLLDFFLDLFIFFFFSFSLSVLRVLLLCKSRCQISGVIKDIFSLNSLFFLPSKLISTLCIFYYHLFISKFLLFTSVIVASIILLFFILPI